MQTFEVEGGRPLQGRLRVPGDKSISHRALILGALAEGTSEVTGLSQGDDVRRTAAAIQAFGAEIDGDRITGGRSRLYEAGHVIDVGNSGTGIRLLAGMVAGFPWLTVLEGDSSIANRPMDRIAEPLREMGAHVHGRGLNVFPPLVVRGGRLDPIDYRLPVASAQVKSCVLLAALGADGETVVRENRPTRAHTEEMLAACGADIDYEPGLVRLRPSSLQPFALQVPGDPSQAAFWAVAAALVPGSVLTVERVYAGAGRAGFVDVLRRMGVDIEVAAQDGPTADLVVRAGPLHATDVDGDEVPSLIDEIPVLAVAAAAAEGTTTFRGAAELRVKESDRIHTIASELRRFGVEVETLDDGLVVHGLGDATRLSGAHATSHGDHRIAMAMAVAGLAAKGTTRIEGWPAVETSYPGFEEDLVRCVS